MTYTNKGLWKYAKAQIGNPYWYGTYGQISTKELYENKRVQYPSQYQADNFIYQLGVKVHDCSGLIKGYMMSADKDSPAKYNGTFDTNAKGLYANATHKGTIDTFEKHDGQLVFMGNSPSEIYHVGIYLNGDIIQAYDHFKGVIRVPFNESEWKYWAQCSWLYDDTASKPCKICKHKCYKCPHK